MKPSFESCLEELVRRAVREEVRAALDAQGGTSSSAGLLNVEEASNRLGISKSVIYKKSNEGIIPSVKQGARLLFEPEALDAYVAANRRSQQQINDLAAAARSPR